FGDIRVAGGPMTLAAVSSSVPFSPLAGTWSGDLIFNTRYSIGVGPGADYDLFSLALHEAGHIFGVAGNTTSPDSTMYEFYAGPRAGSGAAEGSAVQAIYGVREPDRFEGEYGNDTLDRATPLRQDNEAVYADLTTADDVDVYSYRAARNFTV